MVALNPSQRRALAAVRKQVSSSDFEVFWGGVEALRALDDPDIFAIFARGVSIDDDARIVIEQGSEVHRRAKAAHRLSLALEALSLSGALQGVRRLDLSRSKTLHRIDGLGVCTSLRELSLSGFHCSASDLCLYHFCIILNLCM